MFAVREQFRDNSRHRAEALSKNYPSAGFSSAFYLEFIRRGQRLHMIVSVGTFWADDAGATAIEYGLIAAAISRAFIAG
jgi:hypothetical protein